MTNYSLADLGWTPDMVAGDGQAMRLASLHKGRAQALSEMGPQMLFCPVDLRLAVGDWVMADGGRITALVPRRSLLQRRAPGSGTDMQLIAANVDVMFIVTSCNADFNEARLERYLVLAHASGVLPVIVLTKADMTDPAPFVAKARALSQGLDVVALNARAGAEQLRPWCDGTAVLLGSSGVGKSTLANALTGADLAVGAIREDDAKGRHTTTARHLIPIAQGGWLIDTPGVRELQLSDVADGIDILFQDLADLAQNCRFRDCKHLAEPDCAVRAAIAQGEITQGRLDRWRKLLAEQSDNSAALTKSAQRAAGRHTKKSTAKRQFGG